MNEGTLLVLSAYVGYRQERQANLLLKLLKSTPKDEILQWFCVRLFEIVFSGNEVRKVMNPYDESLSKAGKDRTIELAVCFIGAFILILHLLYQPDSAMMKAVVENDLASVRRMIQEKDGLDEPGQCRQTRSFYSTPLIEAARLGRWEILVELLGAGADVNARDEYGTTALLASLSKGDVRASLALLDRGADPNLATCLGHGSCTTALKCARRLNHAELIARIESAGGRDDPPFAFPLECFWMNVRPVLLFLLMRIIPLVLLVMVFGSLLRRAFRRNRRPRAAGAGSCDRHD